MDYPVREPDQLEGVAPPEFQQAVFGHAAATAKLLDRLDSGRLPGGILIHGPLGIGKATLAFDIARRIFDPARWDAAQPVKVVLIGTDFEVSVWQTLLKIPVGRATTYQTVAEHLGRPTASRAVGAAVGKNPISFVVPCHRVVGSTGALTGYHWGVPRKRAILGWEAGVVSA